MTMGHETADCETNNLQNTELVQDSSKGVHLHVCRHAIRPRVIRDKREILILHHSWPRLHEITRPHTALSARFRASRRSVSPLHPDIFFLSPPRLPSAINSSLHRCAGCYSTRLDDSRQLLQTSLAPFNLHKYRARRASGFLLTAFSNATPHALFQP